MMAATLASRRALGGAAMALGMGLGLLTASSPAESKTLTTKRWHFYRGKMHPDIAKSVKLFKCGETPIADEIADYLGVELSPMAVNKFADGETSIAVNANVRGQKVYIVCSTITVDRIMELLLSIAAMRRASAKTIVAVIPFYGYARQDMIKGREPIAAADIAHMLEEMGVDHVVTVDLHSAQIEGFFKPTIPVDNLGASPIGSVYFSERQLANPCVIAPHASAVPKSVIFRDILSRTYDDSLPMAIVVKKHHVDRSKPGEVVGDVKGKDCIVVDNLIDTGSTLIDVAKLLKSQGASSVSAFCVHGRYSSTAVEDVNACPDLDLLVTTNTIPESLEAAKSDKIVTLSVAPFLAEAISCIHTKGSMSQKFSTR
ncbi:hypothetical protein SDRG_06788 [Saprolegnia diclina VS20]|uniref:ribose-phosphate diphosphokinase n=1 Tax=Saprolegnia diclina (strain VS20) TaxID=1156394 RepID=T0QMX3_SAPDV|nr:hypothetical protein SDRG_06788 [Saprolegnia diclina VS20]EQC36051.1 hypothetical protein SDRG_06788 [Saprolegnia diclina VS20]|eukprot:XP_008610813.1 hypothetical protein SDRG_06788 [Saprolegnia diclina VS20]